MNTTNKRKDTMEDQKNPKRIKTECVYGDKCYRRNPAHLREFSHPHLEAIIDAHTDGEYTVPPQYSLQRQMILEQIGIIVEKQLYVPKKDNVIQSTDIATTSTTKLPEVQINQNDELLKTKNREKSKSPTNKKTSEQSNGNDEKTLPTSAKLVKDKPMKDVSQTAAKEKDSDYRPIVPPTRRARDYLKVVLPQGNMAAKHIASAPYHIFYTTIEDAKETHHQDYSITFLEILDSSLGELKCSLQINFMVDAGWLLGQYYFAGYSEKKLTILYEEDCGGYLKDINKKKPQVTAHHVAMPSPFGKHHTKMMVLCYEDGSLRVVVSTANLYPDDWENRTQGLWLSPRCPPLPPTAMPHHGESPTLFKKYLLKYLHKYQMPQIACYVERIKRCDFSDVNVFLVTSSPGGHFDAEWGMTRAASLLRSHCAVPRDSSRGWPLLAQASSLGSYGKEPKLWLTGDFLHNFTKQKDQPQMLTQPPDLKLIYPSLDNVKQSHDGLLGGGCLPYSGEVHAKQPWLNNYLYQWKALSSHRNRAMPHIKSYTRVSPDNKMAAFYLLTSANISKAAWGSLNKSNGALRIMSYEAGVLFLPKFVINEDFFPLDPKDPRQLVIPYDIPPTKYTSDMTPWVSEYLR